MTSRDLDQSGNMRIHSAWKEEEEVFCWPCQVKANGFRLSLLIITCENNISKIVACSAQGLYFKNGHSERGYQ